MRLPAPMRPFVALGRCTSRMRVATFASRHATDLSDIQFGPTWSVNELLSSYPSPQLSSTAIHRLYELSALTPPEGKEYEVLQKNLEELVKLVEAVKLVDTTGVEVACREEVEDADKLYSEAIATRRHGRELLQDATRTKDHFYVVDLERRR